MEMIYTDEMRKAGERVMREVFDATMEEMGGDTGVNTASLVGACVGLGRALAVCRADPEIVSLSIETIKMEVKSARKTLDSAVVQDESVPIVGADETALGADAPPVRPGGTGTDS